MFSIFLSLSIVSCKKEEVKPSNSKTEVSEQNGNVENQKIMIFNTTDEYDQLINKSENEQKIELEKIRKQPFISKFEKQKKEKALSNEINDEFLLSILNEDNIVQIGRFLYKLNISEEKVYVLSASKIDEYSDLVAENLSNKNIRKFSMNENVIEVAESGSDGEKALFCKESYAQSRSEHFGPYITIGYASTLNFDCNVVYKAFGIYFTLKATADSFVQGLSWSNLSTDAPQYYASSTGSILMKIEGQRRYKERCGSEPNGYYVMPAATGSTSITMQSYQGSKGLNKYQMMCNFFIYNSTTKTWIDLNTLPNSQGWDMYPPYVTGIGYGF